MWVLWLILGVVVLRIAMWQLGVWFVQRFR